MWFTTMLTCFYIIYKPYQINAINTPKKCVVITNNASLVCSGKKILI